MKKTALTFVAVAFGMGVAFAQTAPQPTEKNKATTEKPLAVEKLSNKPEEADRRTLKVEELPVAVQNTLKGDELKDFKVLTITEIEGATKQFEIAMLENTAAATTAEPSLVVVFDEKGKVLSQRQNAAEKLED